MDWAVLRMTEPVRFQSRHRVVDDLQVPLTSVVSAIIPEDPGLLTCVR